MAKRTWFIALLAALGGCATSDDAPISQPITLTLLHTNDTHSHLEPFPRDGELSAGNQGPQQGGIARRKALIDAIRASEPNVLLVDAGDNFQGTIFYHAWKGSAEIMALNALGYDATTLGNHEFDRGPTELGRALRGEPVEIAGAAYSTEKPRLPIIATNVDASAEPALRGLFASSVVLERGGEQFGILGVVTEDVPAISSPGPRVRFFDAVASVQKEADRLRAMGINKIILLSHSGYPVDLAQAPRLSGVDIIGRNVAPWRQRPSGHGSRACRRGSRGRRGGLATGGSPCLTRRPSRPPRRPRPGRGRPVARVLRPDRPPGLPRSSE